ncbi:hypothetical protein MCSF7_02462 [Mycoplasmopsis columbina SF7]|uniref:Uncharacterized protein n=1 Tax=Mycoplasmopsis columbina SF7 TaxID=1037410 RepID=F9UKS4_9BACT|nr:hypothetical protein MCSF7_02462 [Mycoplasmopsis columbina SF7]
MSKNKIQNKKFNNKNLNLKAFITTLFIILFLIIPFAFVYIFLTNDIGNSLIKENWIVSLIALGTIFIALLVNFLLFKFKILSIRSWNFSIPIIFLFSFMIFTSFSNSKYFPLYARIILALILVVIITIITNHFVAKKEDRKK